MYDVSVFTNVYTCESACKSRSRASDALTPVLQVVRSWLTWVLGTKRRSSGRAASTLNHTSPLPSPFPSLPPLPSLLSHGSYAVHLTGPPPPSPPRFGCRIQLSFHFLHMSMLLKWIVIVLFVNWKPCHLSAKSYSLDIFQASLLRILHLLLMKMVSGKG